MLSADCWLVPVSDFPDSMELGRAVLLFSSKRCTCICCLMDSLAFGTLFGNRANSKGRYISRTVMHQCKNYIMFVFVYLFSNAFPSLHALTSCPDSLVCIYTRLVRLMISESGMFMVVLGPITIPWWFLWTVVVVDHWCFQPSSHCEVVLQLLVYYEVK